MKFKVNQKELANALTLLQRCVAARTTKDILNNIYIETVQNKLKLIAHNMKIGMEIYLDATIEKEGSTLVSAFLFTDFIKKLPNAEIDIEYKNDKISINSLNSNLNLLTEDVRDYPFLPKLEINESIEIPAVVLNEVLNMTLFAASTDETKVNLNSLFIDIRKDEISFVCLDYFRIAMKSIKISNEVVGEYLIPLKSMQELNKILAYSKENTNVKINFGSKNIDFCINDIRFTTNLVNAQYMKYKDIIPKNHETKVTINTRMFYDALERANLLVNSSDDNSVRFNIIDERMELSINSKTGNFFESLPIKLEGVNLTIAFVPKYWLDALRVIDSEEIILEFNSNIRPCMVKIKENEEFIYIVLPTKLRDED